MADVSEYKPVVGVTAKRIRWLVDAIDNHREPAVKLRDYLDDHALDIADALERAESFWRCGSGHVVYVEPGTPPYEAGPCPLCQAAADRELMRIAAESIRQGFPDLALKALEGRP